MYYECLGLLALAWPFCRPSRLLASDKSGRLRPGMTPTGTIPLEADSCFQSNHSLPKSLLNLTSSFSQPIYRQKVMRTNNCLGYGPRHPSCDQVRHHRNQIGGK
ncbi:hypothetical protein LX36DRAFT_651748 [Colletotrichum falcatum]|nr:hypothetical protein LX36DRAFT_651748 [Colletotrichum falcatum]